MADIVEFPKRNSGLITFSVSIPVTDIEDEGPFDFILRCDEDGRPTIDFYEQDVNQFREDKIHIELLSDIDWKHYSLFFKCTGVNGDECSVEQELLAPEDFREDPFIQAILKDPNIIVNFYNENKELIFSKKKRWSKKNDTLLRKALLG